MIHSGNFLVFILFVLPIAHTPPPHDAPCMRRPMATRRCLWVSWGECGRGVGVGYYLTGCRVRRREYQRTSDWEISSLSHSHYCPSRPPPLPPCLSRWWAGGRAGAGVGGLARSSAPPPRPPWCWPQAVQSLFSSPPTWRLILSLPQRPAHLPRPSRVLPVTVKLLARWKVKTRSLGHPVHFTFTHIQPPNLIVKRESLLTVL